MASKTSNDGGVLETVKTVVFALILAGLIRSLLFQPFWIPSGSMKSTLLIGDFLFVNKFTYGFSYASCPTMFGTDFCGFAKGADERLFGNEPERGDVVVFKHPVNGADYIKRLVGLPGDRIRMKDGILYINGTAAPQTAIEPFIETFEKQGPQQGLPRCTNTRPALGGDCVKDRALETLPNGVVHEVLNILDSNADNTSEFLVPEGHYFFMGDNRDNSVDSRFAPKGYNPGVGFVPAENIIGRADRIIFSAGGSSLLKFWDWRSDRYFKAID
ncbi:MAG: signal peptidase I [Paracoccaceae bacterium]|jgi:signal peptidase I